MDDVGVEGIPPIIESDPGELEALDELLHVGGGPRRLSIPGSTLGEISRTARPAARDIRIPLVPDEGCRKWTSCLTCPVPEDECPLFQKRGGWIKARTRRQRIVELRKAGKGASAIARAVGVSRQHVYRVLDLEREKD